jgi:TolB protein
MVATPAFAQDDPPPVEIEVESGGVASAISIAVPAMPVEAGVDLALGRNIAGVIASGLRSSGRFSPLGPAGLPNYSVAQADAPAFGEWRSLGAQQLVAGFVRRAGRGRLPSAAISTTSPPGASWFDRASKSRPRTGAAPPIAAPMPSIRG